MQLEPDSIRDYLKDIGKIPLLKPEQEIEYGRQIQAAIALRESIKQKILDDLTPEQKKILELANKELRKAEPKPTAAHKSILKLLEDQQKETERSLPPEQGQILKAGDRAKKKMVEANLRLVVSVAKKQRGDLDLMDAVQEGAIGLMRGAEKFNPEAGNKFSTYAFCWIRQGITRARTQKTRNIRLPVHLAELSNKIKKNYAQFLAQNGRSPKREELAGLVGIPVAKLDFILSATAQTRSLNQNAYRGEDSDTELMDLVPVESVETGWDQIYAGEQKDAIMRAIAHLTAKEQQVLLSRFGFSCPSGKSQTLQEVGLAMNISRERVRQIERKALQKMRRPQMRHGLRSFQDSL